jgi:hypothetical protein
VANHLPECNSPEKGLSVEVVKKLGRVTGGMGVALKTS